LAEMQGEDNEAGEGGRRTDHDKYLRKTGTKKKNYNAK